MNSLFKTILLIAKDANFLPLNTSFHLWENSWKPFRAVRKFLSSRLIMNSSWLWNSHQRHKFLRVKASRDILKFRVSGVARGIFPLWAPFISVRLQARLGTMLSKCPRCSTTSHSSNVSQFYTCLNMRSMWFKTGKRMLYQFYSMVLIFG